MPPGWNDECETRPKEDQAAFGVDGIHHPPPSPDLIVGVNAGRTGIAASRNQDRRSFRDDQTARRGTLRVIFGVQRARGEACALGAHSRQRGHHDTMLQPTGTDLER
jgi:hypothetical protein